MNEVSQAAETDQGDHLSLDALRTALEQEPVRVAICYGSQATGRTHHRSDVDLAVELTDLQPGDDGYTDAFFGDAAVTDALDTEDVGLVDVHTLSGSLARAVFETGVLVAGDTERVETLREQLDTEPDERTPPRAPRSGDRTDGRVPRTSDDSRPDRRLFTYPLLHSGNTMSALNVKIPDEMEEDIEMFLEDNPYYLNKSELARDALRHLLSESRLSERTLEDDRVSRRQIEEGEVVSFDDV